MKMFSLLKYTKFASVCILFFPILINSQEKLNTSSLYSNLNGIERIDSLNNYTTRLEKPDATNKYKLGKEVLVLSEHENYQKGKISALNNIGMSLVYKGNLDSALIYLKEAYLKAKVADNKLLIFRSARNISSVFKAKSNLDSCLYYDGRAMKAAVQMKDSLLIATTMNSIGVTYWRKGRFNKSLKLYKTSLKINQKLKDSVNIERSLNNIGASYYQLGNKKLALEYYINAAKVRGAIDSTVSPIVINNIGLVYFDLKDIEMAKEYFHKAMDISKRTGHKLGIAYGYFNYGDLYFELKLYSKAIASYQKAIELYKELNDLNAVAKISNRIGEVYLALKQFKKAEDKFLFANSISKKHGLLLNEIESTISLSKIQILRGEYKKAEKNLIAVLKLAQHEKLQESVLKIYKQLLEINKSTKKYFTALKFHEKYDILKDSLFNEQSARIVADVKEKYEATQKENENIYLQNINLSQKLKIKRQQNNFVYILTGTIFSVLFIFYLVYLIRNRKRENIALHKANEQNELMNKKLEASNFELKKLNSTKDKFFSIIAHDLKNPFNTLLGASQILQTDDGSLNEEEKNELIDVIGNDTKKLYELLENLLFWSRSQTGKIKVNKINLNLKYVIDEIIRLYQSSLDNKNIGAVVEIPDSLIISFDEFMFNTIIRNLLSNAIKFSYYDSKISFIAVDKGNNIALSIKDEGMGISADNLKNIFDEGSNYKGVGTDNEKGTGLGLILCRDFAKENNATISVSSILEKGTTFELILQKA